MKVAIVGGVAGGASAAARLRRLNEEAEIVIFERGEYISFANCGLPYYVGGQIQERSKLLLQNPGNMHALFNIDVRIFSEVMRIFPAFRQIEVKNLQSGDTYREDYDYLLLAPGAAPFIPPITGVDLPGVFTIRNVPDSDRIKASLDSRRPVNAAVIGAGFIGLEMTEILAGHGMSVSVIEAGPQAMAGLDPDMAAILHQYLRRSGVNLYLNSRVVAIEGKEAVSAVKLDDGRRIPTQLVILGAGVKPESGLARDAGLTIGSTGGIWVDDYLRTSDPNIFAVGDAIQVRDFVTGRDALVPLASPANRQGRTAADNICGRDTKYNGVQGTGIVRVMDQVIATTGANSRVLQGRNITYRSCIIHPFDHANYYPSSTQMTLKLLFAPDGGRILGAQIIGFKGVDKRIDVLATAIRAGMSVFDLQEVECAYAPPFSSAKDPVNMAAYTAGNIINGDVETVDWEQVPELLAEGAFLLDVRAGEDAGAGAVQGSCNIPLPQLRPRLGEVPRERLVLAYCRVGINSYIAVRILRQHGFRVRNISGGYRSYEVWKAEREWS